MRRKPDTQTAMRQLIEQVRREIPFDLTEEAMCGDACLGCSSKRLIYLEAELDEWEIKLANGSVPHFYNQLIFVNNDRLVGDDS
ncbi:MAG: hypothetical protein KZQ89_02420 [Candidatus Thiodiazotropha sp. (ex Lucinoma kastoroae)]|nr:hypothetical protein [Candidatus Thiodiazotropha sp. (ex Lucinoma kastoroae)]